MRCTKPDPEAIIGSMIIPIADSAGRLVWAVDEYNSPEAVLASMEGHGGVNATDSSYGAPDRLTGPLSASDVDRLHRMFDGFHDHHPCPPEPIDTSGMQESILLREFHYKDECFHQGHPVFVPANWRKIPQIDAPTAAHIDRSLKQNTRPGRHVVVVLGGRWRIMAESDLL